MKSITSLFLFIVMFFASTLSYAQELVTNGNFEAGQTGWIGNAFNVVTEGGNSYNAANVAAAGEAWAVNLSQVLSLTSGTTYQLKFDAWSDQSRTLIAGIGLNEGPWSASTKTITLGLTSQTFTLTLVAPATSANSRVLFDMGAAAGFVGIDNVSLMVVTPTCSDGVKNGDETGIDCGGSCAACAVTGPTTAAPTPPTRTATDVVSIFSDAYTNIPVNAWGPDWGSSSSRFSDATIASNATKVMNVAAGQIFAGIDFAPSLFDATSFTYLHLDYWIANPLPVGQVVNIKLSNHLGGSGETSAIQYTVSAPQAGSWAQLDIPLADFVAASDPANLNRSAIAQIVISAARADGNVPVDIYLDNIYFYKNASAGVNNQKANNLSIYPNPVVNKLTVTAPLEISELTVRNVLGQSIKSVVVNGVSQTIDIDDLATGNYFVVAKMKNGQLSTQKFSKL